MYHRLLDFATDVQTSYFLFGPRGTGKTSWLKQQLPEATYIDLLDQGIYFELSSRPEKLPTYLTDNVKQWVIIDEIQRIPPLLNEVHRLIEADARRFILTGSSARSLRKKGTNLLAGRALPLTMHPLTAIELKTDFDPTLGLKYGQLPGLYHVPDKAHFLRAYVETYIREEVLQEGLTRNIQTFHRFLEVASFSHAQQINASHIAREIGLDQKTVSHYFGILEDLLLAYRLPVFNKRAKRRLSQAPKFYFFDTGVYQTLRPRGPLDADSEIHGHALEGYVLQELKAVNAYCNYQYEFYFWRTNTGTEVDLIMYGERGLLAIEIKYHDYIDKKDLKGLKAFKADYSVAKCFLIYMGDHQKIIDGIECIPLKTFLPGLKSFL